MQIAKKENQVKAKYAAYSTEVLSVLSYPVYTQLFHGQMHVEYGGMINFSWSAIEILKFHNIKHIFPSLVLSTFKISPTFIFAYTTT